MKFENITRFFREVRAEMHAVTWPSKDDVKEGTVVVIVMSVITSIFLSLVDFGFAQIVKLVFK